MSKKYWGYRSIELPGGVIAKCQGQDTNYGFRHICQIYKDNMQIAAAKACYYNRTWEAWEYQSVIIDAINKIHKNNITEEERAELLTWANEAHEDRGVSMLKSIAMVAKMGEIFAAGDQKASNDWKARMLKAGLGDRGLIMPKDWDQLTEDEKEHRLNAAIGALGE